MSRTRRSAVIDLGSNSVRMMIVETDEDGRWRVSDEERAILRLGDALARRGMLAEDLERAQFVYSALVARARHLGCGRIVAVGTAALRQARDGAAFSAALSRAAGEEIEVIDGPEEARLGFLGAMRTLDLEHGNLTDVGGASTEVTYFARGVFQSAVSLPLGAVTLSSGRLTADPPQRSALLAAQRAVQEVLSAAVPSPQRGLPLVALGGSFRSIAKMHRVRTGYTFPSLHNYQMAPGAIGEIYEDVVQRSLRERARIPGLAAHRAETAVAALLLARQITLWFEPSEVVISGSGLREGILFDRLLPGGAPPPGDLFLRSVENLLFQFGERADPDLVAVAGGLFGALRELMPEEGAKRLTDAAARLRGLGRRINVYDRHRLTFSLVTGARLCGISHREQLILAGAASYEGPRRVRELLLLHEGLAGRADVLEAQRIGLLVAYADAFSRRHPGERPAISAEVEPSRIDLRIAGVPAPPEIAYDETDRLAQHFSKVFGRKLLCRYSS